VELDGKALGRTMVGKRPGKDPVGSAGILIVHANVTNVPDVAVFMTILMGLRSRGKGQRGNQAQRRDRRQQ